MVANVVSNGFILYFLAVLLIYYIVPVKIRWNILLFSSLFFYYVCDKRNIIVLIWTVLLTYTGALCIEKFNVYKKQILWIFVGLDFSVLFYTKYIYYIMQKLDMVLHADISVDNILVPLGISFYTFQTVSYMVDVYRGKIKCERNILKYSLYVSYFPHIIQGPISRYEDFSRQIDIQERWNSENGIEGLVRISEGLFKKLVVCESASILMNSFSDVNSAGSISGIFVGIFYIIMLYSDFSGGIDIIMGMSIMFGIRLKENFRQPFFATSVSEFWRRWHITLGTWFRDYIYIPLGGNRVSKMRNVFNIAVVWIFTGLWHGASMNFLIWGMYFCVLIILEKLYYGEYLRKHKIIGHVYTIITVIAGFLIFSQTDLRILLSLFSNMFVIPSFVGINLKALVSVIIGTAYMFIIGVLKEKNIYANIKKIKLPVAIALILLTAFLGPKGAVKGFIYAQF